MRRFFKPHETRAAWITELGQPPGSIAEETPVPRHAFRVDRVILREPSPVWGPFREWMAAGPVAVEFHSSSLAVADLRRYLAGALWVASHLRLRGPARGVVICWRRPRARLAELNDGLRLAFCEGALMLSAPGVCELLILSLPDVPVIPGTAALRLISATDDSETARARIQHLLTDTTIPGTIRDRLLEDIRMKNFPVTETERFLTNAELREEGRLEGQRDILLSLLTELRPELRSADLAAHSIDDLRVMIRAATAAFRH